MLYQLLFYLGTGQGALPDHLEMNKLSQFASIEVTQIHKLQYKVELHYGQLELYLILCLFSQHDIHIKTSLKLVAFLLFTYFWS